MRFEENVSPESYNSDFPRLEKVANMAQIIFIRHLIEVKCGKAYKEVDSRLRNQFSYAWTQINGPIAREYFSKHSDDPINIHDEDEVFRLFEKIPVVEIELESEETLQ